MRVLISTALGIAASLLIATQSPTPAQAADGCSYGYGGQLYCQPGAQPGVPYGYNRGYYGNEPRYYRHRDRGAEVALGVIGAVGAIAAQQNYAHRHASW